MKKYKVHVKLVDETTLEKTISSELDMSTVVNDYKNQISNNEVIIFEKGMDVTLTSGSKIIYMVIQHTDINAVF